MSRWALVLVFIVLTPVMAKDQVAMDFAGSTINSVAKEVSAEVRLAINEAKQDLERYINNSSGALKAEIATKKDELSTKIDDSKQEILKQMDTKFKENLQIKVDKTYIEGIKSTVEACIAIAGLFITALGFITGGVINHYKKKVDSHEKLISQLQEAKQTLETELAAREPLEDLYRVVKEAIRQQGA